MAIVYKHIRKDTNEVFYVGIGKTNKRAYSKFGRNPFWYNIVNKTDYIVEIIETGLDWNTACNREQYWIQYYGRKDLNEGTLVNLTNGGDGVVNYKHTNEFKVNKSIKMLANGNHFYGKSHTKEVRDILSKKCGKYGSENGFYGKTHNNDVREKLSKIAKLRYIKGELPELPVMYGVDNPSSKPIVAINHNNNTVYFIHGGISKFCKEYDISYHYYKLFKDKGKCKIIKNTHVRPSTKNIVNWEFRTANLAGGDWNRIKTIIQTELRDCEVTIVKWDGPKNY